MNRCSIFPKNSSLGFLLANSLLLAACGGGGSGESDFQEPTRQFSNALIQSGIRLLYGYQTPAESMPEMFGGGVAAGDYDADGDIDLFVVRGDIGPNLLYRNDGNNVFTEVAPSNLANTGSRNSGPIFVDIDGDSDLDLFLGAIEGDPISIFRNDGDGVFSDVTADSGLASLTSFYNLSAAFGDYDLDGDLDMMMSHWGTPRTIGDTLNSTESLWRNDGNFTFSDQSLAAEIAPAIIPGNGGLPAIGFNTDYSFTPRFADINNDNYPDILSVADFGNTRLFINDQDGTFTDATSDAISDRNGMGSAVGDYDNDGDLDWFVSAIFGVGEPFGNRFYRNDDGVFTDVTEGSGVNDGGWGWGACFADFNNDGFLDIFHVNGWVSDPLNDFENDRAKLFISDGAGAFEDQSALLGISDQTEGRGLVCADLDDDGDVDIFTTTRGIVDAANFWRNDLNGANFLRVKLVGLSGAAGANSEAIGARVKITANGVTQMRELAVGNNFISQDPTVQNFGLGDATQVDEISVEWPLVGAGTQVLDSCTDVTQINQTLTFVEGAFSCP